MQQPLISIITPNYNSEKFITDTIESVINQTYENWELIIVDDYSKDQSIDIIKQYSDKDPRIQLIKLENNSGPGICRNKGISKASGKYLTFIDSDDLWLENFLEISMKHIIHSNGFVFASYHRYDENLEPKYKDFIVPKSVTYSDILKTNSISCLTAFIDIEKLGKFYMPDVRYRQDMGLWLQYLKKIKTAKGIECPLAIYRIRANSHSRNKFQLIKPQWHFYRKVENLSVGLTIYYIIFWMINGLKKYYS
jgi:teichuronic acid biosynthesis glycosyltransferase TuaG